MILLFSNFPSAHNEHIAIFLWSSRLLPFAGWFTPERLRTTKPSTLAPFTSSVWVINGVHCRTAHGGTNALPAIAPGLSFIAKLVLIVGRLTYRCPAGLGNFAYFSLLHLNILI